MEKPKFIIVMKKTLEDFLNLKTTLFYVISVLIVPLIFAIITSSQDVFNLDSMTLEMQAVYLSNLLAILSFIWIAGVPLVLFSIIKCAPFISGEDAKGTLLILVSKPLKRFEIILGKLLAFTIYVAVAQAAMFFIVSYLWTMIFGLDLFVFTKLLAAAIPLYIYSIFIGALFGIISTALSAIGKSTVKVVTVLVLIAIYIFFACMMVRTFTTLSGTYEGSHLYRYDLNYHLGNTFDLFIGGGDQNGNIKMIPSLQIVLGTLAGTYDITASPLDQDQGITLPSMEKYHFYSHFTSLFLWIFISALLLAAGIILFERRAIY